MQFIATKAWVLCWRRRRRADAHVCMRDMVTDTPFRSNNPRHGSAPSPWQPCISWCLCLAAPFASQRSSSRSTPGGGEPSGLLQALVARAPTRAAASRASKQHLALASAPDASARTGRSRCRERAVLAGVPQQSPRLGTVLVLCARPAPVAVRPCCLNMPPSSCLLPPTATDVTCPRFLDYLLTPPQCGCFLRCARSSDSDPGAADLCGGCQVGEGVGLWVAPRRPLCLLSPSASHPRPTHMLACLGFSLLDSFSLSLSSLSLLHALTC